MRAALHTAATPPLARVARALLTFSLLFSAMRADADGTEAPEPDPPVCLEALAARPDDEPLKVLADAESAAWKDAKALQRESRRLAKSTLEFGASTASLRATVRMGEIDARYEAALRKARAVCGCRERRGDPYREDCDAQYARWISPSRR